MDTDWMEDGKSTLFLSAVIGGYRRFLFFVGLAPAKPLQEHSADEQTDHLSRAGILAGQI